MLTNKIVQTTKTKKRINQKAYMLFTNSRQF